MKSQNTPTLTPRERLVIQLHYADGWTFEEIAEAVGCHHKNVWRSHAAAIRKLSRCISDGNGAEWAAILHLYL